VVPAEICDACGVEVSVGCGLGLAVAVGGTGDGSGGDVAVLVGVVSGVGVTLAAITGGVSEAVGVKVGAGVGLGDGIPTDVTSNSHVKIIVKIRYASSDNTTMTAIIPHVLLEMLAKIHLSRCS
jgi:hypothetical protein